MIISAASADDANVLTKESLEQAFVLQENIQTTLSTYTNDTFTATSSLVDLCTKAGGSCVTSYQGACGCLMTGILKMWNYDLETFRNDSDFMATLNQYGSKDDLMAVLGDAVFDEDNNLVSAEAFTVTYFLDDRSYVLDGTILDPVNEQWEQDAFLNNVNQTFTGLQVDYFASRSFSDEFGGAISGDLMLVQISYLVTFIFLGATLGRIKCGPGSRWSMSIAAVAMIGLATIAGFGISSLIGLFFGPVHSLLPFILLGIGVDDWYVFSWQEKRVTEGYIIVDLVVNLTLFLSILTCDCAQLCHCQCL
jgi:Niemann-Pick C1 protein